MSAAGERAYERRRTARPSPLSSLLERVLPSVHAWAHGRLPRRARSRVETEDLVQEAAVGALQHLPDEKLRSPETVRHYIQSSIRNRIIDEIRRAGRVEVRDEGSGERALDPSASPLADVIDSEERRRFRTALAQLDERDQILIVGRIDLELSYQELALATGHPTPDAARVASRRAILRLARAAGRLSS